jgi:DNA end-binding protein Ku
MQVLRAVRLAEIDPLYFETSYFVAPDPGGERAYALLFTALQKTERVALAKVAMHGSEHVVLLRPGRRSLLAHTMYYQDEIRVENEVGSPAILLEQKEQELAIAFIEAISAPFAPEEFKDTYREQVQALVYGKISRQEVSASEPTLPSPATPAIDILEALKKSLALAKKPAKPAETATRRKSGKVTEIRSKANRRKA